MPPLFLGLVQVLVGIALEVPGEVIEAHRQDQLQGLDELHPGAHKYTRLSFIPACSVLFIASPCDHVIFPDYKP